MGPLQILPLKTDDSIGMYARQHVYSLGWEGEIFDGTGEDLGWIEMVSHNEFQLPMYQNYV